MERDPVPWDGAKFDFLFLDGPRSAHPQNFGRSGTFRFATLHAAEGATIVWHDAQRPHEQEMARRYLGHCKHFHEGSIGWCRWQPCLTSGTGMSDAFGMAKLAIAGIVLLILGPLLAWLEVVPAMTGFVVYSLGGLLGLVAVLGGLVSLIRGRGARALLLGAGPAATFVVSIITGLGPPPINDITTNLDDPPAFVNAQELPANAGRDFAYREDFKPIVREAYPDLAPRRVKETPAAVYERALERARERGWEITREDDQALIFEGVATTRLFKFRDDFVVRVKSDGEGAVVDMRSKSRDGVGDRGTNAARIRDYLQDLAR